jgi:hypothetical protein
MTNLPGESMTPQESQALQNFLGQLTQVRGIQKDPEADAAIARAVSQQPDAPYLLVQRALLQDQALENAKAQITQLRSELQAGRTSSPGSFLDANSAWGRSAVSPPSPEAQSPVMQAASGPGPMYGSPPRGARPGFLGGGLGGGSFLGNLAATAAGVAGGAFLFQGIQNLMGHDDKGTEAHAADHAAAEPASLADTSSMDADSAAYDDSGLGDDMDFGGDDGTSI